MIRLVRICNACPEQYDAFLGENQIGYFRLRHGHFRVDYPDVGGKTILETYPEGDGEFTLDERDFQLYAACLILLIHHKKSLQDPTSPVWQPHILIHAARSYTVEEKGE